MKFVSIRIVSVYSSKILLICEKSYNFLIIKNNYIYVYIDQQNFSFIIKRYLIQLC